MLGTRRFAPNEVIIRENEPGETAYLIEKGRVEVTRGTGSKRAHLAYLEAGAAFGEMSVVDDLPRSATVTAVEETVCREIHRDEFHLVMKENPEAVLRFLKNIFERLREANARISQHALGAPGDGFPAAPAVSQYVIEALTDRAAEAIDVNPIVFSAFPFKIGRRSHDPLVNNHMEIEDKAPLQISRHHVSLVKENGKIGVVDRGSQLGALVDGVRIGGGEHGPGPVFFKGQEGVLILGTETSPYRYRVSQK